MKTIHDIKCADDMVGIAVQYDPATITDDEKEQLKGLCALMEDKESRQVDFQYDEKYLRLNIDCGDNRVLWTYTSSDSLSIIHLKDFLGKPKKMKLRKWLDSMPNDDHAPYSFCTEQEASEWLKENLDTDQVGYVARITTKITKTSRFQINKYKG